MDYIDENNHKSDCYRKTSFYGKLNEEGIVDLEEYIKLENAVYEAAYKALSKKEKHKKVVRFGIICTSVLSAIVSHEAPDNGYELKNYDPNNLHKLLQRMHVVLEGFIDGVMPNRKELGDFPNA